MRYELVGGGDGARQEHIYRGLIWYLSGGDVAVLLGKVEALFHRLWGEKRT